MLKLVSKIINRIKPDKKIVFISHPFSNNPTKNWKRVRQFLKRLNSDTEDVLFISPLHLFSFFNKEDENLRESIMWICKLLILVSDEVWFLIYTNDKNIIMNNEYLSKGQYEEYLFSDKLNKNISVKKGEKINE